MLSNEVAFDLQSFKRGNRTFFKDFKNGTEKIIGGYVDMLKDFLPCINKVNNSTKGF